MSDININTNPISTTQNTSPVQQPISKPVEHSVAKEAPKPAKEAPDIKDDQYGPVVSQSDDGDTLRVKEGIAQEKASSKDSDKDKSKDEFELQDFQTSDKSAIDIIQEKSAAAKVIDSFEDMASKETYEAPERKSYEAPVSSSLNEYSDSQLKQLYQDGDISAIDYQKEMDSRKAELKAENDSTLKFNTQVAKNIGDQEDVERTANTMNLIESGNYSDIIPLDVRLESIATIQKLDTV